MVGLQEHHSKSHSDMDSEGVRLRGRQWDYVGNISRSLKSGVMILWLKDRWKLVNSYSTCSRMLIAQFEDEDGMEWTIVCAHFHHDPGPRKKQWARLVRAMDKHKVKNIIMLADHNSILDETLDAKESEVSTQANSYYRQITREARIKEKEAYEAIGVTDVWPLVHEEAEEGTKGLTYPALEPRR